MRSIVNEHDGWWAWWSMSLMVDEHNGQGFEQIWEAEGLGTWWTDRQTNKQTIAILEILLKLKQAEKA